MSGWTIHEGEAVALALESVDTDQLIPARFMSVPRSQSYGTFLLHDMRRDGDGELLPDMPLNLHPSASVLVARRNFGSGSSREAAVYALADFGFRAVVAPSFGDIFSANAVNNGLLPLVLGEDAVEDIIAGLGDGTGLVRIDLEAGTIRIAGQDHQFSLPPVWREKLMNGWDDIDLTASRSDEIAAFRNAWTVAQPWAVPMA